MNSNFNMLLVKTSDNKHGNLIFNLPLSCKKIWSNQQIFCYFLAKFILFAIFWQSTYFPQIPWWNLHFMYNFKRINISCDTLMKFAFFSAIVWQNTHSFHDLLKKFLFFLMIIWWNSCLFHNHVLIYGFLSWFFEEICFFQQSFNEV